MHLLSFAETYWKHVFSEVYDAAVYISHEAAECLHWYSGDKAYFSLKNAGASSIHELSLFNLKNIKAKETKKAVIVSTSAEPSFYNETLKLILEKNNFFQCVLFCAVHTSVLDYSSIFPNESKADWDKSRLEDFKWTDGKYETQIDETSVTIIYTPIFTASLNEYVFLTPPFENLMPPIEDKSILQCENDIQFFISSMHSLFTSLNVKEEIYSMGRLSSVVAEKLANLSVAVNRRKNISDDRTVSLILLDRTLDLCTACSYNTESVMGRILCTLPHLNHHSNDIAVNMSPLCSGAEEGVLSSLMVPGCLATNDTNFINLLFLKKEKELLLEFNKMLNEMITVNESPVKPKLATRVSKHSLEILINKFRTSGNIEALTRSSKTLQIIIAVIQALKSDKTAQLELLISFEKLLLQNLAVSRDASSILAQLSSIIQSRATRGLSMDNLLVLLIHVYSLVGKEINFPPQQEQQLRSALAEAIFQDIEKCNEMESSEDLSVYHQTLILLGFGITGKDVIKNTSEQIATQIMDLFSSIANQRESLQNYKSIIRKSKFQGVATKVGLIERLVNDLFDPNKSEIFDLECKTSSLLSTGFNILMKGRLKHPSDSSLIIIYVLGGITADEARIVQEKNSLKDPNDCKLILGGSRLLNPLDVLEKVLLSNLSANIN